MAVAVSTIRLVSALAINTGGLKRYHEGYRPSRQAIATCSIRHLMAKIEPPGNPDGWGDPSPIVFIILILIFFGAWIGNMNRTPIATIEYCRELLGLSQ
ncbi:hypothetical protein ACQ4M4_17130 [Leptolyngbya sp. AN02str]|uniref:hypothetical protein n=1 Tax=Leptolyngbya sp. AN02str TaxID=3423363 RepID=UPI003D313B37